MQAHAEETPQEKAIDMLMSTKILDASQLSNVCSKNISLNEHSFDEGLSYQLLSQDDETEHSKGIKVETHCVMINVIDGFAFHVADYFGHYGHSRAVTCLDGPLRGLQNIADNGILMIQSTDVKWHKNYFEHTYPGAKIYSYSNKQVCEFK
jgi:hypothetical protein